MNNETQINIGDIIGINMSPEGDIIANGVIRNDLLPFKCQVIGTYNVHKASKYHRYLVVLLDGYMVGSFYPLLLEDMEIWKDSSDISLCQDYVKYADKLGSWIYRSEVNIISDNSLSKKYDFCICQVCKNPSPMAEPNQPDGSFKCWSCTNYPIRAFY